MSCAALVLGLHLATMHFDAGMRNENPGVYMSCDGITAGVYRNSVGSTTVYAGYRWDILPNLGVTLAAGNGYGRGVQLGLIPTLRLGNSWRLHFIIPSPMTRNGGIHLSWEKEL